MEEDIVWTTSAMLVPLWCTRLGAAAGAAAEEEEEEEEESSERACMEERSEWRWSLSCWLDLQREREQRQRLRTWWRMYRGELLV
jgi:hypothetical protein